MSMVMRSLFRDVKARFMDEKMDEKTLLGTIKSLEAHGYHVRLPDGCAAAAACIEGAMAGQADLWVEDVFSGSVSEKCGSSASFGVDRPWRMLTARQLDVLNRAVTAPDTLDRSSKRLVDQLTALKDRGVDPIVWGSHGQIHLGAALCMAYLSENMGNHVWLGEVGSGQGGRLMNYLITSGDEGFACRGEHPETYAPQEAAVDRSGALQVAAAAIPALDAAKRWQGAH